MKEELIYVLKRCDVSEPQVLRTGVFFPFGWAWNNFSDDPDEVACVDKSLKELGVRAASFDGMG